MSQISKQKIKANIWKTQVFKIVQNLAFFTPVAVLFWQENGLSLTEIMILQSLFSVALVLLEIPSGYFADVFGRRPSLILASVFYLVAAIGYSLGHDFGTFLIAELLWAVACAFISGADSALVYDSLQNVGEEKNYKRIWGSISFWAFLAVAFGGIVGGWIGSINLRWTWYAMIPTFALLIPIALSLQEPHRHRRVVKKGYMLELLKTIKSIFTNNLKLRWIIIYSAVILTFNQAALWLYQPYMKETGLDIVYFGIAFASFNVVAAIGSKYAHLFEKLLGMKRVLIALPIFISTAYFLMGNFAIVLGFTFAFLQQFVRGVKGPIITDHINKLTPSDMRATILSAEGFVGRLGYAAVIPIAGWVADVYTLQQAFNILGVTTLVVSGFVLLVLHRQKII
ncbi:MAG: MFS transporter [Candidatus Pacebacteria bacterium]|nr:MFS transporter [Candidatus Paceibacterota bacterium]